MKLIKRLLAMRRRTALGLLLSVLFVGTVSAAVFYQLSNRSLVTVNKALVNFCITGCAGGTNPADSTAAGATIPAGANNTYVKLTGIKAYPNATAIYERAVGIQNTDTAAHTIRLRTSNIAGTSTSFATIKVSIVDTTDTMQGGSITYTGGGSWTTTGSPTTLVSLANGVTWFLRVEAKAASSNTLPADVATIDLFVEVVP